MQNGTTTRPLGWPALLVPRDDAMRDPACAEASPALQERHRPRLARLIRQAAASRATVILSGEDGVGKERLARAIHRRSMQAAGPFVVVECAEMPPAALESGLFGCVRLAGDAIIRLRGAFERARGGTLYLDDADDLPLALQQAVADTLAGGHFCAPGHDRPFVADLRLIVSSRSACPGGTPLGRAGAIPIELPPLRDRGTEALALANGILARLNAEHRTARRLSLRSLRFMREYRWPGNIAELESAVHRAWTATAGDLLDLERATLAGRPAGAAPLPEFATLDVELDPADLAWIGAGAPPASGPV